MKYAVALLLVAISMVSGSHLGGVATLVAPGAHGATLKGPSSSASIVGPDGSAISTAAEGGAVVAAPVAGGAITAAVSHGAVVAAVPHVVAAPAVVAAGGALVAGPSGVIATHGHPWGAIGVPHAAVVAPGLGWGHNVWW